MSNVLVAITGGFPMRPSRKTRFLLIFLLVLCALFVYGYTARLRELSALQDEIAAMQSRIDHARLEQKRYEEELAYVMSPDYLGAAARQDFDMGIEGDRLIVPVVKADSVGATSTGAAAALLAETEAAATPFDPYDLPVWQQWVAFLTANSRTAR